MNPASYLAPMWTNLAVAAGRKYNLPEGLLPSIVVNGERTDDGRTNSNGTYSPFQITRATRDLVVRQGWADPHASPQNAADTAARLLRESLDRNKGDQHAAALEYHGGTNPRNIGPRSRAYADRVVAGLPTTTAAPQAQGDDPFADVDVESLRAAPTPAPAPVAAPTAAPTAPAADDPFADVDVAALKRESAAPAAKPVSPPASLDRVGSKAERFALGVADPFLGGAQLLAHGAETVGDGMHSLGNTVRGWFGAAPLPPADPDSPFSDASIRRAVDAQIVDNSHVKPADGGWDVARVGGNILGTAPLLAVPGTLPAEGAGLWGLARAGAMGGGLAGAAAPVADDSNDIAGQKLGQLIGGIGGGALVGGLGGKLLPKLGNGLGDLIGNAVARARSVNAVTPAAVDAATSAVPGFSMYPAEVQARVRPLVESVLRQGRTLDPVRAQLVADAAHEGVQLTPGQIARDRGFSNELNLSRLPGGEGLDRLLAATRTRLGDSLAGHETSQTAQQAGEAAIGSIRATDAPRKAAVTGAYAAATGAPESAVKFVGTTDAAQQMATALDGAKAARTLPADLHQIISKLSRGDDPFSTLGGKLDKLDAVTLDEIRKESNRAYRTADAEGRRSIKVFQDTLDALQAKAGPVVEKAFGTARGLHAERTQEIATTPIVKAALDPKAEASEIVEKHIFRASTEKLANAKAAFDKAGRPEVWQQLADQATNRVVAKGLVRGANGEVTGVNHTALRKEWESWSPEARAVLFSPETRAGIERVLRLAEQTQKYPANHSINTSNSGVLLASLWKGTARGLGALESLVGRAGTKAVNATRAGLATRGPTAADISAAAPTLLDYLPATTAGNLIRRSLLAAPTATRAGSTVAAGRN